MFPTLFEIGPFALSSLWVFVIAGLLLGTLLFLKRAKYERMDVGILLDHSVSLLIGTVLFSRFIFFVTNWGYFGPLNALTFLKQMLFFWEPGYSFWGAVIGFGLVFYLHCRRENHNIMEWLEVAFIPLLIGIMIGNFGQLLDGQGYGKETNLPWGVTFESTTVKYTVPIHPTQIYSMLLIALILLTRKKLIERYEFLREDRNWTLAAIAFFSFSRFLLEFIRGDDTLQFGPVRLGHIVSLLVFVPLAVILYKRFKQFRKEHHKS